jgi:hypothetical protein
VAQARVGYRDGAQRLGEDEPRITRITPTDPFA